MLQFSVWAQGDPRSNRGCSEQNRCAREGANLLLGRHARGGVGSSLLLRLVRSLFSTGELLR